MLYLVNDSFRRGKKQIQAILGSVLAVEKVFVFKQEVEREKGVFVQR